MCIVLILPIFTEVTSKIYAAGNKGTNQKQIAGALVFLQLLGLVNRCLPGHSIVVSLQQGVGGVFSFPLSQGISLCILITFQSLNVSGYKTEYCTQILLLWHLHIYAIILNAMSFLYFYLMKRSPGTYIFD